MSRLIATVYRPDSDSAPGGGTLFLVDLETDQVLRPVARRASGDSGLRGLAMAGDYLYAATGSELLAFDRTFKVTASHHNPYLEDCQSIAHHGCHVFVVSAAFDCIIGFNLVTKCFDWGLKVVTDGLVLASRPFDPSASEGPLQIDKLALDSLHCRTGGMYLAGARTRALLRFSGRALGVVATLPAGARDAMPHQDGILFSDTHSHAVRFESPGSRYALPVPRPGYCRGLCALADGNIAAGSSPPAITVYDPASRQPVKTVSLSRSAGETIHTIREWPHDWPAVRLSAS